MRQIKFRGLCFDEWLYGDLEYNRAKDVARIHTYDDNGNYVMQKAVDPRTVGQFTGLTDCNGKEIYEGDIVLLNPVTQDYGYVKWNDETVQFVVNKVDSKQWYRIYTHSVKVIGNVHDNPDLLTDKLNKQ